MNKYQEALERLHNSLIGEEPYFEMEHDELLQELVDKATPKKIILKLQRDMFNEKEMNMPCCPCCQSVLLPIRKVNYCDVCGQAIDYSEVTEDER